MNHDDCPTRAELTRYVTGTLGEERAGVVEDHLEWCLACDQTINEVDTCTDEFLVQLQNQHDEPDESLNEADFQQAIDLICNKTFLDVAFVRRSKSNSPSIPLDQFRPGDCIGQYELQEILGRGGMGVVFKARHLKLNRTVALKVLNAAAIDGSTTQQRFEREMHAIGQLDHPNIVRATDAAEIDHVHLLVMEFVSGSDLSMQLKKNGPFPISEACEVVRQAAVGLQHIFENGMVHRDLKPANLMLTDDGEVKILDLGLALLSESSPFAGRELTDAGQMMGTLDYMAPEQGSDTHTVDIRADIYSLGATLFALLAGHPPFAGGRYPTLRKKIAGLANDAVPDIAKCRDDVPLELSRIVSRMMERDPNDRYRIPQEVVAALTPFCQSSDGRISDGRISDGRIMDDGGREECQASTDSTRVAGQTPQAMADSDVIPGEAVRLKPDVSRWALTGVCAVAAVVLLISVFAALKRNERQSPDIASLPDVAANKPSPEASLPTDLSPALLNKVPLIDSRSKLQELMTPTGDVSTASDADSRWSVFSSLAEPDVRTDAIHRAVEVVPTDVLLARLHRERNPSTRAGLLLALSEYDSTNAVAAAQALSPEPFDLLSMLYHLYVKDPDAEVHSSVEYLLRVWKKDDKLRELRPLAEQRLIPFDGGWYQPYHVSSMIVIPGPRSAELGSPESEVGRQSSGDLDETQRTVTIPYTFSICSTEVTQYQRWRTGERYWETAPPENPDHPANNIRWQEAAQFCNRLSQLEGISPVDYCYESYDSEHGVLLREKPNALELTGFRLPTDDEWEVACRAGTTTMRPEGNESAWWKEYVHAADSPQPETTIVGSCKPNPIGLFDMIGNVSEWTQTICIEPKTGKPARRLRGGSVWTKVTGLRSSARYYYEQDVTTPKIGFRVARTLIRQPFELTENGKSNRQIELFVGPPACPDELREFVDSEFQPLRDQQIIRVGHWNVGNVPTRRFRLQNNGIEPVRMPELPWMNGLFVFDNILPLELAPNSSIDFDLRMTVLGVGERSHNVFFHFEGMDANALPPLMVQGCLDGTLLSVFNVGVFGQVPKTADLGIVPRGATVGSRFYMWNIGNTVPEARVTNVKGPFTLTDPLEGPIIRLENSFRLSLDATATGVAEGTVTLALQEDSSVKWTFPVKAVVADDRPFSMIGIFRNGTWLIDFNRDTIPDEVIEFGSAVDQPLTGDWNGDGICDVGVWQKNSDGIPVIRLQLRGTNPQPPLTTTEFRLQGISSIPVAVDIDSDGRTDLGDVCPNTSGDRLIWRFDAEHDGTFEDAFAFGRPGDDIVVGDWNGDGVDDVAVSRSGGPGSPLERLWELRGQGPTPRKFASSLDFPIAGDWDGDGDDDLGGWRPVPQSKSSIWQFESDGDSQANCDMEGFGTDTDIPVVLRVHQHSLKAAP